MLVRSSLIRLFASSIARLSTIKFLIGFLMLAAASVGWSQTITGVAGTQNLGPVTSPGSAITTLTYTFGSGGTIQTPAVLTQGVAGLDFMDAGTGTCTTNGASYNYSAGSSCTVTVQFRPTAIGLRMGAVELLNNSGSILATTLIEGTGGGSLPAYNDGIIHLIAGNGVKCPTSTSSCGDGGAATLANFNVPIAIVSDPLGNVYISDYSDCRVRKITASTGIITTIAGFGCSGGYTDNILATSTNISAPRQLALDGAGNLYFASGTGMILKVSAATGIVTAVAGGGNPGSGVGDGGQATSAKLSWPWGLAVDGLGNLYIGDYTNNRIRLVTAATGVITTIAGTGTAGYSGDGGAATSALINAPTSIALDASGNVYVSTYGDSRVRMIDAVTKNISTVAGNGTAGYAGDGGAATGAELNQPEGVVVDPSGNIYIADTTNNRIRMVSASTGNIQTIIGNGGYQYVGDGLASLASVALPSAIWVDAGGNLYTSDTYNHFVHQVTRDVTAYTSNAAPATAIGFTSATQTVTLNIGYPGTLGAISVLLQGKAGLDYKFVLGGTCAVSTVYQPGQTCTVQYSFTPMAPGSRNGAIVLTGTNSTVLGTAFLSGTGIGSLATLTPGIISLFAGNNNPGYSGDGGPAYNAMLTYPMATALDGVGSVYIVDQGKSVVRKVTNGIISTIAGSSAPSGNAGNGVSGYSGDGGLATNALLYAPQSIAIDGAGNIYIADTANYVVRAVNAATGIITTIAGVASYSPSSVTQLGSTSIPATDLFLSPDGLAVDGSGNLYVATSNQVVKISIATGLATLVAGNGIAGYSGDNGPATSAQLNGPQNIAVDSAGNVYIADTSNSVIRKVSAATGIITTIMGTGPGGSGSKADDQLGPNTLIGVIYTVAVDAGGNVYTGMTGCPGSVRELVATTGLVTTLAGNVQGNCGNSTVNNVPATKATFASIFGITLDQAGNMYICDQPEWVVRKITLGSTALTFAATNVGSSSSDSPQTATLNNIGNDTLNFPIPAAGTDPSLASGFTLGPSSTCTQVTSSSFSPGTLAPGSNCTEVVSYTPLVVGSLTGSLIFTDDSIGVTGSTQTVSLVGGNAGPDPVTITSVSPNAGVAGGGTAVTITGTGFASGSTVTFGGNLATSVVYVNSTRITAVSPTGGLGTTVDVIVQTPSSGSSIPTGSDQFQYYTATPRVTAISPASGPVAGGGTVTITGLNLAGVTTVNFGAVAATNVSVSGSTQITATIPAGTAGAVVDVTVTSPNGTSAIVPADIYTYAAPSSYTVANTPVGSTITNQTAYVNITTAGTSNATLGTAIQVVTQGLTVYDYAYVTGGTCATVTAYTVGQVCSVDFSFTPTVPGQRPGAIILSSGSAVLGVSFLSGIGTGPQVVESPGTITVYAGIPQSAGYSGDNGAATNAKLNSPSGIVFDPAGNLYIADYGNSTVRKVNATTGNITMVAGVPPSAGYTGDNGPATGAKLSHPTDIALDGAGNLYIADGSNYAIRKVSGTTGIITTVAGGNGFGYNGDNIAATSAKLNSLYGIDVDGAGNFYFAEYGGGRIRMVNASTGIITTVAGTGTLGFSGDGGLATNARIYNPYTVKLDAAGNIYFTDSTNCDVRKVTVATGIITSVAGTGSCGSQAMGGLATATKLQTTYSVVMDAAGDLFIGSNLSILKVTAATGIITTIAGSGGQNSNVNNISAADARFPGNTIWTAIDGFNNLYVAEYSNSDVRKVSAAPYPFTFAATNVGSTSAAQTLTVSNTGNSALTFPIPGTGTDPAISAGYSIGNSSTCPQVTASSGSAGTLASGSSCTDLVSYQPLVTGTTTGSLVNTDDSLNAAGATQTLVLNGGNAGADPITVTSLSPTGGTATGGTTVTINGTGYTNSSSVKFGGVAATSVVYSSATKLTAVSPAGTAGVTVDVIVTTGAISSVPSAGDKYTYTAGPPTVTGISPTSGAAAGGGTITITGTNLNGATAVKFGSASATNISVISSTSLTATIPSGTSGSIVDITVTTPGGTSANSAADQFTYLAVPTLTSILPSGGVVAGGTTVAITGTNFTSVTAVTFGAVAANSYVVNSTTSISAVAPAGTGTVDVTVTTAGGTTAVSAADQYTYYAVPTVTAISPALGSTAGGTSVTITGTGFTGATAVSFGAVAAASFTVNSATSISAVAPAGTGTVDVTVTTAGGTTAISAADQYTYYPVPTVSAISPDVGSTIGGTTVAVTGTSFTGATAVKFGNTAASSFTVNSATSITATAPAESAGNVYVYVTNSVGTSVANPANQYTYIAPPVVTGISPASSTYLGGTTVTITGTGFANITAVYFGAVPAASFTVNSSTQIAAVTPAESAATVDITVISSVVGSSATSAADQHTFLSLPTLSSISPVNGRTSGGTAVTITGTNFTGATAVNFGAVTAAGFTINSASQITATTPAEAAGTVDVTVTTPSGTTATTAADLFTFAAPTVTLAVPSTTLIDYAITTSFTPITGQGGIGTLSYSVTPALPSGLIYSTTSGAITGTPTVLSAAASYTVTVTDSNGATATASFSLAIVAPTITITPASLSAGVAEAAYSQTLASSGGSGPYSYTLLTGSLPTGVTLSSTGVISGTPTVSGNFSFSVKVSDTNSFTASQAYTLQLSAPTITLAPTTLTAPVVGATYLQTLASTGGLAGYSYKLTAGALPTGITLSSAGVLSGTTVVSGNFSFTVTATDADSFTGSQAYSFTIAAPAIALTPASLTAATVGVAYSQTITSTGGATPYAYSLKTGALPAGLTLSSTGIVSGTPTAGGTFLFTVQATDANSYSGTQAYTFTVNPAAITLSLTSLPGGEYNSTYSPQTIAATGGISPYVYAVTGGSLPGGLSLSSGGVLTGTPTAAGSYSFTVKATDSSSGTGPYTGSLVYSFVVARQPSTTALTLSTTSITPLQSVTLTVNVSASLLGTPTGSVSLTDGGNPLGSAATLSNGSVSVPVSGLLSGQHLLCATYNSDANFLGSASSCSTVTVAALDFNFNPTGTSTQTVMPGRTASYTFALAALYSNFPGAVTFSVAGLPAGTIYTMTPATVNGFSATQTATLTIQTSLTAENSRPGRPHAPFILALLLPLFGLRKLRRRLPRAMTLLLLLAVSIAGLIAFTGCGAGIGFFDHPATSSSITVTAASGSLHHTAAVTLNIQ